MARSFRDLIIAKNTNCFCAFCKTPRRIPEHRHVHWKSIGVLILFCAVLMFAVWGRFEARVLIVFTCLLGLMEVGAQWRWRLSINCRHCGFDPVLYLKNPGRASERVKAVLDEKRSTPFGRLGLPDLPYRVVEGAQKKAQEKDQLNKELQKPEEIVDVSEVGSEAPQEV